MRTTSILLAVVALITYYNPGVQTRMQFDRAALYQGELWRLVTCHWAHWSPEHLFWSGGMFISLLLLPNRASARRALCCVAVSALVVGLAVWACTDLHYYRGLSGIDSALFVMLAIDMLRAHRAAGHRGGAILAGALLLAFVGKIAYESVAGGAIFVDAHAAGMVPVPLAHLVGAAVGLAFGKGWRDASSDLRRVGGGAGDPVGRRGGAGGLLGVGPGSAG